MEPEVKQTGLLETIRNAPQTLPRWKMPCVWFSVAMVVIAALSTADFLPVWGHKVATWLVAVLGSVGSVLFPGVLYNRVTSDTAATVSKENIKP